MRPNRLRELHAAGTPAIAGWVSVGHGLSAEVLGHAFDAVIVDLQHGLFGFDTAITLLQAVCATPAMPMARVAANDFTAINRLLDAGAYGLVCPLVDSAEDARRFVSACRYPPRGTRSFGPTRAALWAGAGYFPQADDAVVKLAMIETPGGLQALDDILAVDGLDGVFVGPSDLTLALGARLPFDHRAEPLAGVLRVIVERAHRAGRMAGIFCGDPAFGADMVAAGFDLVVPGADVGMLRAAAGDWAERARAAARARSGQP